MTSREKKEQRKENKKDLEDYYCWVINERTGHRKLVSKDRGFVMVHGYVNQLGLRTNNLKDRYRVQEIKKSEEYK